MGMRDVLPRGRRNASPTRRREVGRIRRGVVQVRKVLLHTSSVTFGDSFSSRGERAERCQWQKKRGERVAAVEKIEEKRKPEDFFGHRNRRALGAAAPVR